MGFSLLSTSVPASSVPFVFASHHLGAEQYGSYESPYFYDIGTRSSALCSRTYYIARRQRSPGDSHCTASAITRPKDPIYPLQSVPYDLFASLICDSFEIPNPMLWNPVLLGALVQPHGHPDLLVSTKPIQVADDILRRDMSRIPSDAVEHVCCVCQSCSLCQ
jgi:hypothetical protein